MGYGFQTASSLGLNERLRKSMPGGNTRSTTFFAPYPLALVRGAGYKVWDVDGNEYIDYLNNYTSLVHGHAAPAIIAAITRQAALGTVFPAPTELQAELAERICFRFPSIERLRFTNSGTEANLMAVRVARAFTSRVRIVKAFEGYHGAWEQLPEVEAYHDAGYAALLRQQGIPQEVLELVAMVPYNDSGALESVMRQHGDRVAAIILEPVLNAGGVKEGAPRFMATARELADRYGALLILDEVVTARLHTGGRQAVLGVRPDLTTLGKIIGGGLPVGALGGRADVIDMFDPQRPDGIPHSGTYNGNQLTMAAGCVSLDLLTQGEISRINALGERLASGLRQLFSGADVGLDVTSCGSLVQIHTGRVGWEHVTTRLHREMLGQGIYYAPRGLLNISTPMDEAVIDHTLAAFARATERVRQATEAMGGVS